MALIQGLKQGLRIAGKIDRKYNLNKIFIQKYVPPGYRARANKLVDIAGTLGGGYGIVRFLESLYAPETPGNGASIPFKKYAPPGQSYKTRYRYTSRRTTRRDYCPRPNQNRGQSRSGKQQRSRNRFYN